MRVCVCALTIGSVIYFRGVMTPDPHPPPTPSALHQTALCGPPSFGGSEEAELPFLPVCVSVSLCVENQTVSLTCVCVR